MLANTVETSKGLFGFARDFIAYISSLRSKEEKQAVVQQKAIKKETTAVLS